MSGIVNNIGGVLFLIGALASTVAVIWMGAVGDHPWSGARWPYRTAHGLLLASGVCVLIGAVASLVERIAA